MGPLVKRDSGLTHANAKRVGRDGNRAAVLAHTGRARHVLFLKRRPDRHGLSRTPRAIGIRRSIFLFCASCSHGPVGPIGILKSGVCVCAYDSRPDDCLTRFIIRARTRTATTRVIGLAPKW